MRPWRNAWPWLLALLLVTTAAAWQRLTGPTHPWRGWLEPPFAAEAVRLRLPRSGTSGEPLRVAVRARAETEGVVRYRRYPTNEAFRELPMAREGEDLAAPLPSQPPAGKLEYSVTLRQGALERRLPPAEAIVMRFKGRVPAFVLVPHVALMFLGMLVGVRAALAAARGRPEAVRHAGLAAAGIGVGGLLLGPIVQKHAFGAFWTGWPLGGDLTDNKTALLWLAWVVAWLVARRRGPGDPLARATVGLAAIAMLTVYLIPHSLRGSQLDYGKIERGTPAQDAIGTGGR